MCPCSSRASTCKHTTLARAPEARCAACASEMRVTWTQRYIQTPVVRYGPQPNTGSPLPFSYPLNATPTPSTYNQGDLCSDPDQTSGWFDPGQVRCVCDWPELAGACNDATSWHGCLSLGSAVKQCKSSH